MLNGFARPGLKQLDLKNLCNLRNLRFRFPAHFVDKSSIFQGSSTKVFQESLYLCTADFQLRAVSRGILTQRLAICNGIERFSIASDVIDRVPSLRARGLMRRTSSGTSKSIAAITRTRTSSTNQRLLTGDGPFRCPFGTRFSAFVKAMADRSVIGFRFSVFGFRFGQVALWKKR